MNAFQLYAAFGAPAVVLLVAAGLIGFNRWQDRRSRQHTRDPKSAAHHTI